MLSAIKNKLDKPMSLEYWELKHSPSDGDTESWQLKLKIPASELISFLNNLPGIIGEPSKLDETEFNFRVFIYEVKPGIFPLITDFLKEKCPVGEVYDDTKKGAFESILDGLAQSLETLKDLNDNKRTPAPPQPPPQAGEKPSIKEPPETERLLASQNDQQLSYKDISEIFNVDYNPQYTFSSYVTGRAQKPAVDLIRAVAEAPGAAHNPFFIQAAPGTGKTHLLHAIAQQACAANVGLNVFFIDPELFIAKMSNSFKDGSLFYAKRYFLRSDILLVDNIELFKESVIYQKQLASIFRYLLELKKQIVITSESAKEQLDFLDAKLFELVNSSFTVKIDALDNETRMDIFGNLLKASNMRIDDQQVLHIFPRLPGNFRSMEAFIKRLKLYTAIKNDALNDDMLDKALAETISSPAAGPAPEEPAAAAAPAIVTTAPAPAPVTVGAAEPVVAEPEPVVAPELPPAPVPDVIAPAPEPVVIPEPPAPATVPAAAAPTPASTSLKTPAAASGVFNDAKKVNSPGGAQPVTNVKTVKIGIFYPAGYYLEAVSLRDNFNNCIAAHKFPFTFEYVFLQEYTSADSPKYKIFIDTCIRNDVQTAVTLCFLRNNLSGIHIPSIEDIKKQLALDPASKVIFFEYIDNKIAAADRSCLQFVLDITISKGLK